METNKTSYVPSVTEIDENVKVSDVPFTQGQFIISDNGESYYDPTNGTSTDSRISLGGSSSSGGGDGEQTAAGGFQGGNSASATSGGAIGQEAKEDEGGGAVGNHAAASAGGAVGNNSFSSYGGSVGNDTYSTYGGAVGNGAHTSDGFAGGYNAKAMASNIGIDAIQLGTGTNSEEKTLQAYNYQLMDADGFIPKERLGSSIDGINLDSADDIVHFGVCSTAAATAAKTVSIPGFKLVNGAKINVLFSNSHTASSITLNVNSTGAKSIRMDGKAVSGRGISSSKVYQFVYYNNYYYILNPDKITELGNIYGPSTYNDYCDVSFTHEDGGGLSVDTDNIYYLPGNYTLNQTTASANDITSCAYVKGHSYVDRNTPSVSSYGSTAPYVVFNLTNTTASATAAFYMRLTKTVTGSHVFENLIINYTDNYGRYNDSRGFLNLGDYECNVKFKNCQFNFNSYQLISIGSGSIEFENCSFYFTNSHSLVCARIVQHLGTASAATSVSYKNCKIVATSSLYLFSEFCSSTYPVNLNVDNCDILLSNIYEQKVYNRGNKEFNISITNNILTVLDVGNSAYNYGYTGLFLFSGNNCRYDQSAGMLLDDPINLNVLANRSIITDNRFTLPTTVAYRQSYGTNQNVFNNNICEDALTLYGAGHFQSAQTSNSAITAIGNSVDGTLTVSGFGKTQNAYNTYN